MLSEAERAELESWYLHLAKESPSLNDPNIFLSAMKRMDDSLFQDKQVSIPSKSSPAGGIQKLWYKISAAASIILISAVASYFIINNGNKEVTEAEVVQNNIKPGTNIAKLKLADGTEVILDSARLGEITAQAGISVKKLADGRLVYEVAKGTAGGQFQGLNSIITPTGGQYQVQLPDGTSVWLNSSSSLTYPMPFDSRERKVELSGEAYFEVAKLEKGGQRVPFIVETKAWINNPQGHKVEVLGTHFNIKAYSDEKTIATTLVEGRVRVGALSANSAQNKELKPGQQSVLSASHISVADVNTEEALAWKSGLFMFDEKRLEEVLKMISRWYGVDVKYENEGLKNLLLSGSVSRFASMAKVLQVLQSTGTVAFSLEGRTLLVSK